MQGIQQKRTENSQLIFLLRPTTLSLAASSSCCSYLIPPDSFLSVYLEYNCVNRSAIVEYSCLYIKAVPIRDNIVGHILARN